jgi:Polysulphide reductase, NrfD
MQIEGKPRPGAAGYADRVPTKPPNWHGLVVWDVLLNNLSSGLFLAAGMAEWAAPQTMLPIVNVAYVVALVFILADLVLLVIDLGDPWRFHHMLRVFKPSSPMSMGVWALSVYSFGLTAVVAMSLPLGLGAWTEDVRRVLVLIGLPFGLLSAAYKGVLFSTTAQPGWRDGRWLGGYLTTASVMLGVAQLLMLAVLLGQERATELLRPALALMIVANAVPLGLLLHEFWPTWTKIHGSEWYQNLGFAAINGGMGVPLGLLLLWGNVWVLTTAVALVLVGSVILRYLLVFLPHSASERVR